MNSSGKVRPDPGAALLDLYDAALPQVYGYLLARCGRRALAEDWHPTVAGGGFPSPFAGVVGGHAEALVAPSFRVRDVAAACTAVRAAGGTAPDPVKGWHGVGAHCTDDQRAPFALGQITGG